jgi:hypothetical protein
MHTSGLGVVSVCMNMVRRPRGALEGCGAHRGTCGLWRRGEDVMGDAFWWMHRVAALDGFEVTGRMVRDSDRNADRESVVEAMLQECIVEGGSSGVQWRRL